MFRFDTLLAALFAFALSASAQAGETTNEPALHASAVAATTSMADEQAAAPDAIAGETRSSLLAATLDNSLSLIGIRYKRGGQSPLTGFDCSGFVGHVFQGMGLTLPRSAKEISQTGQTVEKDELKPGDLVFFNTMRRKFSHVGIYLGANLFLHSPRTGGKVRVDDMTKKYWTRAYNGARRVSVE